MIGCHPKIAGLRPDAPDKPLIHYRRSTDASDSARDPARHASPPRQCVQHIAARSSIGRETLRTTAHLDDDSP